MKLLWGTGLVLAGTWLADQATTMLPIQRDPDRFGADDVVEAAVIAGTVVFGGQALRRVAR